MATSGTYGQTQLDIETLLKHAFLRCGKLASTVGGELLRDAREAVQMMLWALSSDGVNLWCLNKNVFNLKPGAAVIPMAVGTVDIINVLARLLQVRAGTPFVEADAAGVLLSEAHYVRNVSGTFAAGGIASLVVEASVNGTTWEQVTALNGAVVEQGSSFSIDLDNSLLRPWWRVRDTSSALLPIDDLQFRTIWQELPASRFNRDDYQQLPDKSRLGQRVLQYWFDKEIDSQLWIWPVPQDTTQQLVVWDHSLIQDLGAITNELAVPRRWYQAIVAMAAEQIALIIPPTELPPGRLQVLQQNAMMERERAQGGENDGSPLSLLPRISVYTR